MKRRIGVLLFDGFELLDVFGPLEMYGIGKDHFDTSLISFSEREVTSSQGSKVVIDEYPVDKRQCDILLIPGGIGTRTEVNNSKLLDWLAAQAELTEYVTSVCTGSALLAKAGLLSGRKATTNKLAFDWVESVGTSDIIWQRKARWAEDGKFITSSGISAGIDMTLAVIGKILDIEQAKDIAHKAEYIWNSDPESDPFQI